MKRWASWTARRWSWRSAAGSSACSERCSRRSRRRDDGCWACGCGTLTGIGTVTFCDPETGVYGALGHGLTDEELGTQVPLETGTISEAEICGVTPGSAGAPGALNGEFGSGRILGTVDYSGSCGIYGTAERAFGSFTAEVGHVQTGPASILATVDGREVREFAVQITRVYRDGNGEHVMLSVTDGELLNLTGGIVQGMSGSPILQEGKLVGAVTHVFVSDPSRGYGLSIQDMLDAAGIREQAA